MLLKMNCANAESGEVTLTPLTLALSMTVSGDHKALVIGTYRNGAHSTLSHNGQTITPFDSQSYGAAYFEMFVVENLSNGDTLACTFGLGDGIYID